MGMSMGSSCHLGRAGHPRCSVDRSASLPASLLRERQTGDRPWVRAFRPIEIRLAFAGWLSESPAVVPARPCLDPPVPPPRSLRLS
jgi:hypothetical protein